MFMFVLVEPKPKFYVCNVWILPYSVSLLGLFTVNLYDKDKTQHAHYVDRLATRTNINKLEKHINLQR